MGIQYHIAQPDGSMLIHESNTWFVLRIRKRLRKRATEYSMAVIFNSSWFILECSFRFVIHCSCTEDVIRCSTR
jgi:hypothetical protein